MNAANIARMVDAVLTAGRRGIIAHGAGSATQTVRDAAAILDWRVETLEGPRVNLNDLEIADSPLSRLVGHARQSDVRHVFVMRDVPAGALEDREWFGRLQGLAARVPLVVETPGAPPADHGWRTVELED